MLAQNKIDYAHQARLLTAEDLDTFDYVLAMDNANLRDILALGKGRAVVRPFLDYAPENDCREVPDPFFTGGFEAVYALVTEASEGLLKAIREEKKI